jgi:hypothetical protein
MTRKAVLLVVVVVVVDPAAGTWPPPRFGKLRLYRQVLRWT